MVLRPSSESLFSFTLLLVSVALVAGIVLEWIYPASHATKYTIYLSGILLGLNTIAATLYIVFRDVLGINDSPDSSTKS